ncbi:helix-turn-helix transcriptional regulator [Campylobacter novaezeelandiae]|uniref:helix-turn-helix transcriptional regulator n=1 Tax=Campylobacter novaezeelandiae TaxID=2267891 RepID=UPI00190770D2|nr:AraC family transcriptional regulator [Campylobacter novaezeelandiae]MBK1963995.1 helix-turn-helix transcriptional regulator [Campylobacter novaezeelandiae]MBK1993604.1 helix-turn-helix transcriptional regulator [Campylobacter novaezeelandiae]
MKNIILPNELKKIKNITYQDFQFCIFAKYIQKDNSYSNFVNLQNHLLVFVRKGYKILHTASKNYQINPYELLFLKSGTYTFSNIGFKDSFYEAYLFFFDNSFLIELIYKYKDLLNFKNICNIQEVFWIKNDDVLNEILESFSPYFEKNIQIFAPIIKLKFEEFFLYLILNQNTSFINFLNKIFSEFQVDLSKLFKYYDSNFLSIREMADFAKLDITFFSKEFKKNFGTSPKKWLDEKRLEKARILLEFSKKNINEIANECAFSSVSWFIDRFKRKYNQTPKQYQKLKNLYFLSKN